MFNQKKIKIINNKNIFLLIILISIVLGIFTYQKLNNLSKEKREVELITSFFDLQEEKGITQEQQISEKKQNEIKNYKEDEYIGVLQIPSIKLQKGFFDLSSKSNTVKIGLEVIEGSQMPNKENSKLVIAGHSGNGYLAFFKDLNKVKIGDNIYIYYEGYKYTYKLDKTSITDKNGKITVELDIDSQSLVLTTCNPENRDNEQLILISKLINKEKYK